VGPHLKLNWTGADTVIKEVQYGTHSSKQTLRGETRITVTSRPGSTSTDGIGKKQLSLVAFDRTTSVRLHAHLGPHALTPIFLRHYYP
jgi:hypothetical protein